MSSILNVYDVCHNTKQELKSVADLRAYYDEIKNRMDNVESQYVTKTELNDVIIDIQNTVNDFIVNQTPRDNSDVQKLKDDLDDLKSKMCMDIKAADLDEVAKPQIPKLRLVKKNK